MPKDKWPQWRLTFKVGRAERFAGGELAATFKETVLQFQPVYAGSPAAAVDRALASLESMAGRREARHIRANLTSVEVARI